MQHKFNHLDRLRLPPDVPDVQHQLVNVLDTLTNFGAERIIAFGSCVHGTPSRHSDIDLCVVLQNNGNHAMPGYEARQAIFKTRPRMAIDLLVRTPDKWALDLKAPFGIMEEVLNNGVVLYERRSA